MDEQGLAVEELLEVKKKRKMKKVRKKKVRTPIQQTSGDEELVTSLENTSYFEGYSRSEGVSGVEPSRYHVPGMKYGTR